MLSIFESLFNLNIWTNSFRKKKKKRILKELENLRKQHCKPHCKILCEHKNQTQMNTAQNLRVNSLQKEKIEKPIKKQQSVLCKFKNCVYLLRLTFIFFL